jgi:uncharacterized paraquat-inducible protein A
VPVPRRYDPAPHSSACYRCGRRLTAKPKNRKGTPMLVVAAVLFVVWALGFFAFHVGGSLIHILLVTAIVSLALHFVRGWP